MPQLDLFNQKLEVVQRYSFYGLTHLKDFNLENNNLSVVNDGIMLGSEMLKSINLRSNSIVYIHESILAFLSPKIHILVDNSNICCFIGNAAVCVLTYVTTQQWCHEILTLMYHYIFTVMGAVVFVENFICLSLKLYKCYFN